MADKGKSGKKATPEREPTTEVTITWDTEDVLIQLRDEAELDSDVDLSLEDDPGLPEFCGNVLDALLNKHDADVGLNWNVLGTTIRMQPGWADLKKRLNPPKPPLSICTSCGRGKAPIGRDVPGGAGNTWCTHDECEGYRKNPPPTTDWP